MLQGEHTHIKTHTHTAGLTADFSSLTFGHQSNHFLNLYTSYTLIYHLVPLLKTPHLKSFSSLLLFLTSFPPFSTRSFSCVLFVFLFCPLFFVLVLCLHPLPHLFPNPMFSSTYFSFPPLPVASTPSSPISKLNILLKTLYIK